MVQTRASGGRFLAAARHATQQDNKSMISRLGFLTAVLLVTNANAAGNLAQDSKSGVSVAPHCRADSHQCKAQTSANIDVEIPNNGSTSANASGRSEMDVAARQRQRKSERKRFKSRHIIMVDTLNFNKTVTQRGHDRLLVAFYDASSQSFKDLRPALEEIADALGERRVAGDNLGALAVCDVSVNSFLGIHQAPEIKSSWQEVDKGFFRFGRPNFYPLIVIFYRSGEHVGEYTGVVSAGKVVPFLERQRAPMGGVVLGDETSLRAFLQGKEPVLLGCGLTSNVSSVFNETAHFMHGTVMYGRASIATCTEVLGAVEPDTVVWARGNGAALSGKTGFRTTSEAAKLNTSQNLAEWFSTFQVEVLEELTPDNSHLYLARKAPLVILLLNPKNLTERTQGDSLFEDVQEQLNSSTFNFVWADCKQFGYQFKVENRCPAVVLVDTMNMDTKKVSVARLYQRSGSGEDISTRAASLLLKKWLLDKSKEWRKRNADLEAQQLAEQLKANQTNITKEDVINKAVKDQNKDTSMMRDDFFEQLVSWDYNKSSNDTAPFVEAYKGYGFILARMASIKRSYFLQYEHLEFDFSAFNKVQKMGKHMDLQVETEDEMRSIVNDPKKLKKLWQAIEARSKYLSKVKKSDPEINLAAFMGALNKATMELCYLHRRLFYFLHKHARKGTLGVPVKKPINVDRRAAHELSVREFVDKYARVGKPVIITGLNLTEGEPWTLDYFRRRCNKSDLVTINAQNKSLNSWGHLEVAGLMKINTCRTCTDPCHFAREFIETFQSNQTRRSWYLHDISIPLECSDALGPPPYRDFTVPKYFAGDYFQRAAFQGMQHSWPSLFVGANGTESSMHIDNGGTNFWLYLLSGRKEWRFFSRDDLVNLYQSIDHQTFYVDVFDPDVQKYPLFNHAQMYSAVQEPGDLIFIPGGNPHGVRNVDDIHGVSMNYVDASNIWLYLTSALSSQDFKSFEMFTDGKTVPHGLLSSQQGLRFGDWKSTPWTQFTYDIQ